MIVNTKLKLKSLTPELDHFFHLAGKKIKKLNATWDPDLGTPVFTVKGKYTTRGWTEWTQGFMYGCQILQFDATDDEEFLAMGKENTVNFMAPHVSHIGVHDHGFNNVSTYGNLRRLALEGRFDSSDDFIAFCEMALKVSGAVQAARWSTIADGSGYIHSFNGPHSLFSDTIRSCRALVVAHQLGHVLMGENDKAISLLERSIQHIQTTLKYNVYYGNGRDTWDERGRVVHESIFNMKDGNYRCPSTQQGYSPFSTWIRGLAWILTGCAEQLEYFASLSKKERKVCDPKGAVVDALLEGAMATSDFIIANSPTDGIPYWDTGAPGLAQMGDYLNRPSAPDNDFEPIDSSAAAIFAQGLLRLGKYLTEVKDDAKAGKRYFQAGLTVARNLLIPPYLSTNTSHQGLILHSVYHRPNNWDYIPRGKKVPFGESSMWGDYHAMELAVYLKRLIHDEPYMTFFI